MDTIKHDRDDWQAKANATKRTKQLARLIETAPALRESDIKHLSDLLVTHPRLPESVAR